MKLRNLLHILLLSCIWHTACIPSYSISGFARDVSAGYCLLNQSKNVNLRVTIYSDIPFQYRSGTFQEVSAPSFGTISGLPYVDRTSVSQSVQDVTHQIVYTPTLVGVDTFTYNMFIDGSTNDYTTNTATATIHNLAPVALITDYNNQTSNLSTINTISISSVNNATTNLPNYGVAADMAVAQLGTVAYAYVCYPNANTISIIDMTRNAWIANVFDPSGYLNKPSAIAVSPDNTKAYVCNIDNNTISIIDTNPAHAGTTYNTVIGNVNCNSVYFAGNRLAPAIAFTPDGTKAYFSLWNTRNLYMINPATDTVTQTITCPNNNTLSLNYIAVSPDGSFAYLLSINQVSGSANDVIYILQISNNTIVGNIQPGGPYVFQDPRQMAISDDGKKAYVVNAGNNTVSIVDLDPASPAYRFVVGSVSGIFNTPIAVAFTPDTNSSFAYVVNQGVATYKQLSPFGQPQYVVTNNSGTIAVINSASNSVINRFTGYGSPNNVYMINSWPVGNDQTVTVGACSMNNQITLSGVDPLGSPIASYAVAASPAHGSASLSGSTVTYTPTPGYIGIDTFTFTVTSVSGQTSAPATVTVQVDQPIAYPGHFKVAPGYTSSDSLAGSDYFDQSLTYAIVTGPSVGSIQSLNSSSGTVLYAAPFGYAGLDSYTFNVTNLSGISSMPATVTMTVESFSNVNPTSLPACTTVEQNVSTTIELSGVLLTLYSSSDVLSFGLYGAGPAHGTVTNFQQVAPTLSTCTYTSTGSYIGADSFQIYAVDSNGYVSSPATVYVNIVPASKRSYLTDKNSSGSTSAVSEINVTTGAFAAAVSSVPNYGNASDITITPDGTKAYVCYQTSGKVGAINAASNTYVHDVTDTGSYLSQPYTLAVSPNGSKAYVCDTGVSHITVVNPSTDSTTGIVSGFTQKAISVVFTPDGTRAYALADLAVGATGVPVSMINVATNSYVNGISGPTKQYYPYRLTMSADGNFVYLIEYQNAGSGNPSGLISVIDTNPNSATYNTLVATIQDSSNLLKTPNYMAISPDGLKAYVVNSITSGGVYTVSIVDLNPIFSTYRKVVGNVTVSSGSLNQPISVEFTADGAQAYVTNSGNNTVSIIDVDTDTVSSTVSGLSAYITPKYMSFLGNTPVATSQSVSYTINTGSHAITLSGVDPLNQTLTYALASNPAHGTASLSGHTVTYTPNSGYVGSDSFTFTVTNTSSQTSVPATVSITINDTAPTANAQTVNVGMNSGANTIVLTGSDAASSPLTYTLGASPSYGTLSDFNAATGTVVYTPNTAFGGQDSFTFTVTNAYSQTSSAATVTINVNPRAADKAYIMNQVNPGSPGSVTVINAKTNALITTIPVADLPRVIAATPDGSIVLVGLYNGTVVAINGRTDTVIGNVSGSFGDPASIAITADGTTAIVCDNGLSTTAHVIDIPTLTQKTPLSGLNGGCAVAITQTPINPRISGNFQGIGYYAYICNANANTISVYKINSSSDIVSKGTINNDSSVSIPIGIIITPDGSKAYIRNINGVSVINLANSSVTAISSTLSAGFADLSVSPIQINPTVGGVSQGLDYYVYARVEINSTDSEIHLIAVSTNTDVGTVSGTIPSTMQGFAMNTNGTNAYICNKDSNTQEPLGILTLNNSTMSVNTIGAGQSPYDGVMFAFPGVPTANAQSKTVLFNSSANSITLTGLHNGGTGAFTYRLVTAPSHGTVSGLPNSTGLVTYTPTSGYAGSDSFTFTVTDSGGTSSAATVSITVSSVPVANAQSSVIAYVNTPLTLTLTGSDASGQSLTFTVPSTTVSGGRLSSLTQVNSTTATVVYTPLSYTYGLDSFAFTVTNTSGYTSAGATVGITVKDIPVANASSATVIVNSYNNVITLTASDPARASLMFNVPATTVQGGTLTLKDINSTTSARYYYTPRAGSAVADSFTFTVKNASGQTSSAATVSLSITDIPPVASAKSFNTVQGLQTQVTLYGTDAGGLPLTFYINSPAHGAVSANTVLASGGTGIITYTAPTNYTGSDSFTFYARNTQGQNSPVVTVNINVNSSSAAGTSGSSTSAITTNSIISKYAGS